MENSTQQELAYYFEEPNVKELQKAYTDTLAELSQYFYLCRCSYDDRRNYWPGKSRDMRKHGADAFPWEGASDLESHVIDERISKLASMLMVALRKANIRATPTNAKQTGKSKIVSGLLKWMVSSGYIPRFYEEAELGINYLLERGILVTYVGYHKEDRRFLQKISVAQIQQSLPELVKLLMEGKSDGILADMLVSTFEGLSEKRAMKAIKQLRDTGEAEFPTIRREVDSPIARTLAPDSDFFFPPYVTDPQRAPYCFYKTFYTVQELEGKVKTDGWDEDFVDQVIKKHAGVDFFSIENNEESIRNIDYSTSHKADELVEIIHVYQRLVDPDDGAEGIYETVVHKTYCGDDAIGIKPYAKRELLNGYEDYPVVVTKLGETTKRLYDVDTIPSKIRGIQNQVKVERDARIDRNSMSTLPPLLHPTTRAPKDVGPGRRIPYSRKGELEWMQGPQFDPGSIEIEQTLQKQADALIGLDFEDPISQFQREHIIGKVLSHYARVIDLAYKCFQRFGPDEVFFRVTGDPNPQVYNKGDAEESYSVTINYDILSSDPENIKARAEQMAMVMQMDRNGKINGDKFIEWLVNSIDPIMAEIMLEPSEAAQERVLNDVTNDLAKIFAGIEVPARPNGAQIAIQAIQQYASQPDIQQKLAEDEAFRARLEKYQGQYVFQMQQMQNAQIGRIGTAPANMGGMDTQNMQR